MSVPIYRNVLDGVARYPSARHQHHRAIPAQRRLASADSPADVASVRASTAPARKGRLILVEDNDGVRIATELFLKLEGYTMLTAGSLAEAEAVLEQLYLWAEAFISRSFAVGRD